MNYKQCENLYKEFETGNVIKILINNEWLSITDIEEDAHRGWICVIDSEKTLELSKINPKNIKIVVAGGNETINKLTAPVSTDL